MSLLLLLACNGSDPSTDDTAATDDTGTAQPQNQAPSAPQVAIEPAQPMYGEALTCTASGSEDPDGDSISYSYAWTVNGVDAGVAAETVDGASVTPWQTWACVATASDGELTAEASAEVTVGEECVSLGGNGMQMAAPSDTSGTFYQMGTDNSMTVEGWFRLDFGSNQYLFYKGDTGQPTSNTLDYYMGVSPEGVLHAAVGWSQSGDPCAYMTFEDVLPEDTWFHIALTWDAQTSTRGVYVDGEVVDTCVITAKNGTTYGPLTFGGHLQVSGQNYYPSGQFSGSMDEVRISSVVRYDGAFTPAVWFEPDADTLGLFHFNDDAGTMAADASGNYDAFLFTDQWVADDSACDSWRATE